jgi:hypothetical protein
MRHLKGFTYGRGPIVLPNATQAQKDEMRAKGVKIADIDENEAEKLKREIGER